MKILALGALVALASGCFASADDVSAREQRAVRAASRAGPVVARSDSFVVLARWASDAQAEGRSVGVRPIEDAEWGR